MSSARNSVSRWVLVLPLAFFSLSVWLFNRSENEARADFEEAREQWRKGQYEAAIHTFETLQAAFPRGRFADNALWEIATIYYLNLYDINQALYYFEQLIELYPESQLVPGSHLKLAEIYQLELNDASQALENLKAALAGDINAAVRREVHFKVADSYFRQGLLDEAFQHLQWIENEGKDEYMLQQARVRMGTILQMKKDYKASTEPLLLASQGQECGDCQVQALLGLVESYEFLDDLPRAIESARAISVEYYPAPLKAALLKRLQDKKRYYNPKLWTNSTR